MLVNLNSVLAPAREKKYGVGLFNALSLEMARGIIETAQRLRAPVIVGTAEVLLPFAPLENVADILIPMAKRADVPVVVHYDHGLTYEKCVEAMELGFSSIMYDCSTDTYEENVRKVADMTALAHSKGVSVEAELGHVGDNEGSAEGDSHMEDPTRFYTDPAQAEDFVKRTGVDALAVAVGTAHGAYKLPPKLDFERITTIAKRIHTPLVLHGGSGLSDKDFHRAIQSGISKVNIFTDIDLAAADSVRSGLEEGKKVMSGLIPLQVAGISRAVEKKMKLFGSDNTV